MKKVVRSIRSSRLTLKFANANKRERLTEFLDEYSRVVKEFTARFWAELSAGTKVPMMPSGEITKATTWISARAIQCAAKQASGIANGSLAKNKRREWQAAKFEETGQPKKARVLRAIIAKNRVSCPCPERIEAQLDARFFDLSPSISTTFEGWLTLKSFGSPDGARCLPIIIPIRHHLHFNKLNEAGSVLNSIRLSSKEVSLSFELPEVETKVGIETLGIDIGQTSIFSTSKGDQITTGNHEWTLKAINNKMARCKRGSKGFKRAESHCKNFVGESVNKLNFNGASVLRIERIKGLKRGRRTSKSLSHWSAVSLLDALKQKAQQHGVRVFEINPMFTSQRCSCCGWVQKANRNGTRFVCKGCLATQNADLNGAVNISLDLPLLPKAAREQHWNRKGFFWKLDGFQTPTGEFIVRHALKPKIAENLHPQILQ